MESTDEDENLKKLIDKAMEERIPDNGRFFFSKEINLGHLVVTIGMFSAAFITYLSFHDSNRDNANHVKILETQQERTDRTIAQLADSQTKTEKAVTQLTWIVDRIEKKEATK